jgi:hypothetical protein
MLMTFQNKFTPFLTVLLAGVLLAGSCASGRELRENEVPPEVSVPGKAAAPAYARFSREARIPLWRELPPGAGKIPVLTIGLGLIDFTRDPGERLFRDTLYRGLSARDYAEELVRIQTIEYRGMGEEALNNLSIMNSETLNWSYDEHLEARAGGPRLLVIVRDRAFYSGGAHPNYDKTYFVFDRELVTQVRLADIIREESLPALRHLVNGELRAGKGLGPGDSLKKALFFVDEAELSENFFLSPQGLGFHWDPYEIASYAEGYVEALVPFGEIETFLSPRGLELVRELRGN